MKVRSGDIFSVVRANAGIHDHELWLSGPSS
jgi:hypothetical protein